MTGKRIDKTEFVENGSVIPIGDEEEFEPVRCVIEDIWLDANDDYWHGERYIIN